MTRTTLIDTETTALIKNSLLAEKHQPQIIEFFGCSMVDDSPDLEELEFFCDPGRALPAEITAITGITSAQLKGQPPFGHFAARVKALIEGSDVIVAHNLSYDQAVIDCEMRRLGQEIVWPANKVCTVEKTEHLKGHRLKLADLHELLFGERFAGAHRARTDVEALARCYFELVRRGEI